MTPDERQFLKTAAWLFLRHGQRARALTIVEALSEEDPRDGAVAAALAGLLLDQGDREGAGRAVDILRMADFPPELAHASAVLESRALRILGRGREADERWRRFVAAGKGAARSWVQG